MTDEQEAITKLNNSSILQWKPLNMITFDQRETDNINQMKTISKYCYIKMYDNKSFLGLGQSGSI